jgi:hypothetical protein
MLLIVKVNIDQGIRFVKAKLRGGGGVPAGLKKASAKTRAGNRALREFRAYGVPYDDHNTGRVCSVSPCSVGEAVVLPRAFTG